LLTKILRDELDFNGLVFCEGEGLGILVYEQIVSTMKEAGELCLKAGVDVSIWYEDGYMNPMRENVQEGKVSIETVDRSVRRILRIKFLLGLFENPYVDVERAVKEANTKESRELARHTAREGIVLLKNEKNLLPLNKNIKSIAVIGPNADAGRQQLGDYIADTILQNIVTVLEGVRNKVSPKTKVTYVKGCEIIGSELNEINKAKEAAKKADIAIVVVGEDGERTNGEPNDVASLDLTGLQEDLLKAVYSTGTPTIAVLINGRALSICWAAENIPAILEGWMCGEEGGNAIADVLFGDCNPGGRLPVTFARHSGQLPVYYNYMPSKEYWITSVKKNYVDMSSLPLYHFGFGLSYTSFEYSNLQIIPKVIGPAGEVYVNADVQNTGKREGSEVVQLYFDDVISSMSTPVKELAGFEKVSLAAGEKKTVKFKLTPEQLSFLDRNLEPVVEPGIFEVMVGSSSEDIRLKGEFEVK
jgi:beta-glucosidase